jgi:stage IV sporulation protein FB
MSLFFVVLHEYGHCLMARKLNMKVVDVTITPIGGVAQIYFKYNKPIQELAVALAGPAVNMVLVIPFSILTLIGCFYFPESPFFIIVTMALMSNIMLAVFNLLPVFPMDGGRVLRSLLSRKFGHEKATFYAVRVGQIGGAGLAVLAFCYGYWLAGIIFIFMGMISQAELSNAKLISHIYNLRLNLSQVLNKPEVAQANLPELILVIQSIEDIELKDKLKVVCLLSFLTDLERSGFSI